MVNRMGKRLQKILSALLLILAIVVTQIPVPDVAAQSSDFQISGKTLVKYSGTAQEMVTIPAGVRVIGEGAFEGHDELVKVVIGEQVEEIAYNGFADCDNLHTVVIGDSVSKIDSAAFQNCTALSNVSLGSGLKELGSSVFAGCKNLTGISLNEKNSYLTYQSGIIYNKKMTKIYQLLPGYRMETYHMPDTVTDVQAYAFWGNTYLKNVNLGSRLSAIPEYAFSNCIGLQQVSVPYSVSSVGLKAFEDCVNLKAMNLPGSVSYIHDTAFDGCRKIQFDTSEGSYADDYVKALKLSDVEETEYEDVTEHVVIEDEPVQEEAAEDSAKESPLPSEEPQESATPEVLTQSVESENLLGKSYIVSGKALVFIDNKDTPVYRGEASVPAEPGAVNQSDGSESSSAGTMQSLLHSTDGKGGGFPKYVIIDDKIIANQAYYRDQALQSYDIPQGIQEIGDFAFARSGLKEINIPDGVETIGYAAFYHCDSLQNVTIPDSVKEIGASAFENTPWIKNFANQAGQDFLIVGDGILIAYSGADGVVNIPEGTKKIAAGVFKDHMGITAVYLPDSLESIGEEAFAGCRNLKIINGAKGITQIKDRAFYNCALSAVTIPESVEEIGLMAFALAEAGTDTVVFKGSSLPVLTYEATSTRLNNDDYRSMAFQGFTAAVVESSEVDLSGTVLDEAKHGFRGVIQLSGGEVIADTSAAQETDQTTGVLVRISSESLHNDQVASATMPGNGGSYILKITDSAAAGAEIENAYAQLYGNRSPANLMAYDISLYEQSSGIPITKLGKQYITVILPLPEGIGKENLHVVCTDENGQLEDVSYQLVELEEGECIQFTTTHFSAYGIYQYTDGIGATAVISDGKAVFSSLSGMKDDTPDTGDGPHPKWFLAFGLLCASIAIFFYKRKPMIMN